MAAVASNPRVGHGPKSSYSSSASSSTNSTENPVPSITLSITQDDVKRVLEASEALSKKLDEMLQEEEKENVNKPKSVTPTAGDSNNSSSAENDTPDVKMEPVEFRNSNDESSNDPPLRTAVSASEDETTKDAPKTNDINPCKRPLHELVYQAARQCENSMLQSFLDRMKYSGSSTREIKAGVMVFSEMELNAKIGRIFEVLGEEKKHSNASRNGEQKGKDSDEEQGMCLSREGALSLFRAVIIAIASCIHKNAKVQIEMKDTGEQQRAAKRRKPNTPEQPARKVTPRNDSAVSSADSVPSLETPTVSFDNSNEEHVVEKSTVRKEFEEIAVYATDRLVKFAIKKSGGSSADGVVITFAVFQNWRRAEGARIAPWLDLLNLSRWKTTLRSAQSSSSNSQTKNQAAGKPKQQVSNPVVSETKVEQEQSKSAAQPVKQPSSSELPALAAKKNDTPVEQPVVELPKKVEAVVPAPVPVHPISGQVPPYVSNDSSRTVLSFDFSGSLPEEEGEKAFCITITEANLKTFRGLVERTGLINRSCNEITTILLEASKTRDLEGVARKVIPFERFHTCLHKLLGSSARRLSKVEKDLFFSCFVDFFGCFDSGIAPLEPGEAFTHELAVGFCFLCAGNKSSKLAAGFEFIEKQAGMGLTSSQLIHFLRSYLTMLAGISFLTSSPDGIMKKKLDSTTRKLMYSAVENGARWTLGHFLKDIGLREDDNSRQHHTFEAFASWYSNGGFNTAPWLELLDLKKLLALVTIDEHNPKSPALTHGSLPAFPGLKTSSPEFLSPRRTHGHPFSSHKYPSSSMHHGNGQLTPFGHSHPPPAVQVLFTFPLANQCSLYVLKEDATYVREVVDQLGLLQFPPEEVWATLFSLALKRPMTKKPKNMGTKSMMVGKSTFVDCMQETVRQKVRPTKKRSASGMSKSLSNTQDVLTNFFRSFDLFQYDQVSLNELMGGLTLLCGGKKSTKLSFAFSLFDRRPAPKKKGKRNHQRVNSLDGEELFLFLRSFLIVTFSCCRQSWDLTDDDVNRYIADTANMVTDDVMQYQLRTRNKKRVDFDEFGQWYNEGGYERAPWLELLDLTKWVLVEDFDALEKHCPPVAPSGSIGLSVEDPNCPPAPPDEEVDASLFDDDTNNILSSDSFDEMDFLLMQQASTDNVDAELSKLVKSFPNSPKPSPKSHHASRAPASDALRFHIVIDDSNECYIFSMSQKRISHLRHVLMESGLHKVDCEKASKEILSKSFLDDKSNGRRPTYVLTKDGFDSAMRKVIVGRTMSVDTQRTLSNLLNDIFYAFDYEGLGKANAFDIACGFTLLCRGKKSDKLEFAFETLDREKGGCLKRSDLTRYLRSFLLVLVKMASANSLDSDYIGDEMTKRNGEKCDSSNTSICKAVDMGCEWATVQVMDEGSRSRDTITFDDFAEWYTRVGHRKINWVELLDLNKWVVSK